jgi:putative colanic acid biosynthesis acetyltransferase WcaF
MIEPDLSSYDNSWYSPGRGQFVRLLWFFLGLPILRSRLLPSSSIRSSLLRLFGSTVGRGVVLKPGIRVKYPWHLSIGDHSWIGEEVWIDNLTMVTIGTNVCISQAAYICTGNHDWSDRSFGLQVKAVAVEDGSWIGAKALVCPGVTIGQCAVVAAGSVVTSDIPSYEVHGGNPAQFLKRREFSEAPQPPDASLKLPPARIEGLG